MSWFDTTSIASFAKTALKEAQKTLDKALDIQEDDVAVPESSKNKENEAITNDWGSFSGSYFSVGKTRKPDQLFGSDSEKKPAPLATPETELTPIDNSTGFPSKYTTGDLITVPTDPLEARPKTQNRLSVVSNESRKSSESVEILGSQSVTTSPDSSNSLPITASTDSVEVIDSLTSPSVEILPDSETSQIPEISSPGYSTDSVEVIEEDELSSVSDNTATTMISHHYRMTDSCQDLSQASSKLRSGASTPDVLKLSLPSHGSCDLLSESIQETDWEVNRTRSPIRRLLSKSEEKINGKLEIKSDRLTQSTGTTSSDSQSVIDSSCEGTIVAEEESKKCSSTSSSLHMKELLAEAIGDESSTREPSPTLSEKSRSDVVKIGSEQTSGHTSGDELETTSSDIEVISRYSPNGDSSSTSRHSPAKLLATRQKLSLVTVDMLGRATGGKLRGHQRQLSEASSGCSEENSSEAEKLSKKIMELTEVLEAREAKLVELSRSNLEMQEKNITLKKQLDIFQTDSLSEKDELIRELREEGEKLSKHQLKQSNVIKALRKQEQTQQASISNYKKQIETQLQETETLRNKLTLKEEIEKSQAEKLNLLTGKMNRQDREIATLMDQLEQAVIKAEQLRVNLDAVQSELESKKQAITVLEKKVQETSNAAETAKKDRERIRERDRERDSLVNQIEQLRLQIKEAEQSNFQRETQMREEKKNLLRRLEDAEGKKEELAQSISASTRPLLRQLEQVQLNNNQQRTSWEQREKQLLDRLDEAIAQQHLAKEAEKAAKQEVANLRARLASLEAQTQKAIQDAEKLKSVQDELEKQCSLLKNENSRILETSSKQVEQLLAKLACVQKELSAAEAATTAANQRAAQQEKAREIDRPTPPPPPLSPALSFGHVSISESESWPQFADDAFETSSISGRNLYDSVRGGSSTLLEGLQAQLKMRDGEALQLQWEMHRRDTERLALTAELTSLTARLAERDEALAQAKATEIALATLQRNYDALLQMHGEKVEEVEELRLDLQDVKEMYKTQIDQLLLRNSREEPPG